METFTLIARLYVGSTNLGGSSFPRYDRKHTPNLPWLQCRLMVEHAQVRELIRTTTTHEGMISEEIANLLIARIGDPRFRHLFIWARRTLITPVPPAEPATHPLVALWFGSAPISRQSTFIAPARPFRCRLGR